MNKRIFVLCLLIALSFLAVAGPTNLQVAAREAAQDPADTRPAENVGDPTLRVASPVTGTVRYTVTDLGPGYAYGLNEKGQVVGALDGPNAFLWLPEADYGLPAGMNLLGDLGVSDTSVASDINDEGLIVGEAEHPDDFDDRAILWQSGGISSLYNGWSHAHSINGNGDVVGNAEFELADENTGYYAFMWQNGDLINLGALDGKASIAYDINDSRQIVGQSSTAMGPRAFLWENGNMSDIGVDFGGGIAIAVGINEAGTIIGSSNSESGRHAFVKQGDGEIVDLGNFGGNTADALGINNAGQVVGTARDSDYRARAFIWENGVMTDLNDLIDPAIGWELITAYDINDLGQIVGFGLLDGQWHAFLLTPEQPPWTVMFYLDGDNDLAASQPPILNQLELAADNPNVNVIVLWDGAEEGDSAYIEVQHDTDLSTSADYTEGENYWDQGELDMSYYTTLTDFVTWAMSNYPAQHYALFLTDHGGGLGGGLLDDGDGGFHMQLDEMQQAFLDAPVLVGETIDVLYMDMCLMGMLEVAYEMRDYADYMVASDYLQWAASEPYFDYIDGIEADTTPEELSMLFASAYATEIAPNGDPFAVGTPFTISAVDMSGLDAVVVATDALALALQSNMEEVAFTLGEVAEQVQRYDMNGDGAVDATDSYADLFHLAELIEEEMAGYPEIVTEAQALQAALQSLVIAEHHGSSGTVDLENSHGISIFFPTNASSYYDGFNNDFATGTDWGSLVSNAPVQDGIAWGPMLVDYIQKVNPDGPNTSEPPAPVGRLVPQAGAVYLPLLVR